MRAVAAVRLVQVRGPAPSAGSTISTMILAEELLLSAIDTQTGRLRRPERLGFALRGAELSDLVLSGRITVRAGRITVADPTSPGNPGLNRAFAELRARTYAPSIDEWLRSRPQGPDLARRYLRLLKNQGAVRFEQRGSDADIRPWIVVIDDARRHEALAR